MSRSVSLCDAKDELRDAVAHIGNSLSSLPGKKLLIPLSLGVVAALVAAPSMRRKAVDVLRWAVQRIHDFRESHGSKPKYMVTSRDDYNELRQTIHQAECELKRARARLKACKC